MTHRIPSGLAIACAAILTMTLPAAGAMERKPGVCDGNRSDLGLMEPELAAYCQSLRSGLQSFKQLALPQALAWFERASNAATALPDPESGALARDEARGARALVLAAMGDPAGASALLRRPRAARFDTLALLRAYFLLRQDLQQEAAAALRTARIELADFWCDGHERVLRQLEAAATENAPERELLADAHYLPSYLKPAAVFGCLADKAETVSLPTGRSFRILFDPGQSAWRESPANREHLARMADTIGRLDPLGSGTWIWRITGHSDQQCPSFRKDEAGCREYNRKLSMDRAGTIVERLVRDAKVPPDRLRMAGAGMERPLINAGFDKPEAANRRVELTAETAEVAAASTEDCPWTVRVYDGELPVAGGSKGVPSLTLTPGAPPFNVSRDTAYEVLFDRTAGRKWAYVSALNQVSNGGTSDLLVDGRVAGNAVGALVAAGGRLPADATVYFRVNREYTLETLVLSVADGRNELLERLTGMATPPRGDQRSTTQTGLPTLPEPQRFRVVTKDPRESDLPPEGRTVLLDELLKAGKGGTGRTGPTAGPGEYRFRQPENAEDGRGQVAAEPKSCRFTLSFR